MTASSRRPGTTVAELVEVLRARIISGEVAPGVRLSQHHLAVELNVSRTPLREALQRLATEGFVTNEANRGMVVAPAPLSDVEESYALRLLVEPPTVASVAADVSDDDVAAMERALSRMEDANLSTSEFQTAHREFHMVIVARYPLFAARLIDDLHMRIYRQQRLYFSRPPVVEDLIKLDRIYLSALAARDGDLARHLLEFHLLDVALGTILDVDAAYQFEILKPTLRGLGIDVTGIDAKANRPFDFKWRKSKHASVPSPLMTHNLSHSARAAARTTQAGSRVRAGRR